MEKKIGDFLHLYLGCDCMTPDGIGKLVGLPFTISSRGTVNIHFGIMVKTKHSIDGGYDKTRNHGYYAIDAKRYEPIDSEGITYDGFDMPGGVKPILRRLSDMTEEEYAHIAIAADEYHFSNKEEEIHVGKQYVKSGQYFPEQLQWFLSRGFDLFDLIDSGLAIDRSTLKTARHE